MHIIVKDQRKAYATTRADHLCGRLILWNVGTPEENSVVLASEYRPAKYEISPQVELTPFPIPVERTLSKAATAIHKVLQRFDLVAKPVLH